MPYGRSDGGYEKASRLGQVDLAKSDIVKEAMERWVCSPLVDGPPADLADRVVALADLPGQVDRPDARFALAFDGSLQEVAAREKYPSVRVEYVQLAGVAVVLPEFFDAREGSFVDPRRQAAAVERQIVNGVLPGSNISDPGSSSVDTWRRELYELFRTRGVSDFGGLVSMLDGLGRLYGETGTVEVGRCPEEMCNERQISVPLAGGQCSGCGAQIWPTDVLRTHEEFDEDGSNLTPVGRVMNFCERLLLSMYIEGFARSSPDSLGRGIFIADGPLALFGTVAPIKRRFVSWWQQMTTRLNERGALAPLVVGIEKSGAFVDHAAAMAEFLRPGDVLHMDDAYIRAHIAPGKPGADPYGKDEFFGRKFIYKTSTDNVLVVTVPRITGQPYAEAGCESLDQYPTLAKTLVILDDIQTRLYKDAVIPVALAHSAAALPLGTGTRVLEDLARQALSL